MARWKYTIRRLGRDAVIAELRSRFGIRLEETAPRALGPLSLHLDWRPQVRDGLFYRGISVENGRLRDTPENRMRSAVRRLVDSLGLAVRITPQQDLLLCDVPGERRGEVDRILAEHGVPVPGAVPLARRLSMACPAKPTCGLAMTEAERVLPSYLDAVEAEGLGGVDVVIRMTGCPNGCARPSTAEIGIVGYGKNDHMIQVGGSRQGTRIGKILYPRVPEEDIRAVLVGLLRAIREHAVGAPAGDFLNETPDEQLRAWVGWSETRR